jgi:hypothetical protein
MAADLWCVVLRTGDRPDDTYVYGPIEDQQTAESLATFLTAEVDPATAQPLSSPTQELLAWYQHTKQKEATS